MRLRGLVRLTHDGVAHGATFVERHHRRAADKTFRVLERFSSIAAPTGLVRRTHDGVLSVTYGCVRTVNRISRAIDLTALDALTPDARPEGSPDG